MKAKQLIESIERDYDIALDFIEHEVGPNDFANNWPQFKKKVNIVEYVKHWLGETGTPDILPENVIRIIDELAAQRADWLTPFSRRLP